MKRIGHIKFGIPTLDNLFLGNERRDVAGGGIVLPEKGSKTEQTSACIVGPDGSGKSLFALHLASRYAGDVERFQSAKQSDNVDKITPHRTQIIFVSTDFSHARAAGVWSNFGLEHPFGRKIPFESLLETNQRRSEDELADWALKVHLTPYHPIGSEANSIAAALSSSKRSQVEVKFLDVAQQSSGDDWAFVGRLLSLLPEIADDDPSHLLVIDAVEGFETLVGENDQFGERQSRRARIAQIMRLAARKCHLVFVAEEPENEESIPEQFVADVVIRLRSEQTQGTTRHSLEIEKARGQRHALGRQPYFIRDGSGSSTGSERNLDDPRIFDGKKGESFDPGVTNILESGFETHTLEGNFQGYVHVTHSIHQRSREILELDRETGFQPLQRVARFGIANLDSLLMAQIKRAHAKPAVRGLPYNRLSALIGEAGTNKSDLAQLWMSQAFSDYCLAVLQLTAWFCRSAPEPLPQIWMPDNLKDVLPQWKTFIQSAASHSPSLIGKSGTFFDPLTRGNDPPINTNRIDPAFAYLYRTRKIEKDFARITKQKTLLKRAIRAATLFLRARYGITCERIPKELQDEGVAVLLSTRDDTSDTIAHRMSERILHGMKDQIANLIVRDLRLAASEKDDAFRAHSHTLADVITDQIKRRLIVRRLEIHNATPEGVFHIIESLVHAGRRVLLGDFPYQKRYFDASKTIDQISRQRHDDDHSYFKESGRIRFVLDDFSSFRDSYPDLKHDSVFLPFLAFWLGRMGVTGLIVCTADGQPTSEVTDPVEVQLRALVAQRVQTWRVGFHGTQRIAVTAIPSYQWDRPSPVRELIRSDERIVLDVSREFELYANLAQSRPERVPLEIRLFSHTQSANTFIAEENKVFRSVFGTQSLSESNITEPGAILFGARTEDYEVLRDFCHLQGGARLDRTLILQIDEFWLSGGTNYKPAKQSALRDLSGYLNDIHDGSESAEDFYGIFRSEEAPTSRLSCFGEISENGLELPLSNREAKGTSFYPRTDRVPFTWDFGFLLCNRAAWIEALDEALPTFPQYEFDENGLVGRVSGSSSAKLFRVKDVWNRLPGGNQPTSRQELFEELAKSDSNLGQVNWNEFLMAASTVARVRSLRTGNQVGAFDFSRMSKGTLVCLLLEIWASEIYKTLADDRPRSLEFRSQLGTLRTAEQSVGQSLDCWLQEYRTELFMSLLLLTEVLTIEDFVDATDPFEARVGEPLRETVATRHWYSTACNIAAEAGDLSPVGLPGHFSIRGDWYLAVAEGSRSDLLAERALDLLSSRRSNVMRMQIGMGLATRTLGTPAENRTRLSWFVPKGSESTDSKATAVVQPSDLVKRPMSHSEVAGLGACGTDGRQAFGWLWRSSLENFDRQSRVFRKSVINLLQRWYEHRNYLDSQWVRGFELYDFIVQLRQESEKTKPKVSSKEFWHTLQQPIWRDRLNPDGRLRVWHDVNKCCDDTITFLNIATHGQLTKSASA